MDVDYVVLEPDALRDARPDLRGGFLSNQGLYPLGISDGIARVPCLFNRWI